MPNNGLNIRVEKIISEFGLNKASFARRCGFGESQTRQFLVGTDVGITKVLKVIDAFPELNPMWILKGENPMYNKTQNYTAINNAEGVNEKSFCSECYRKDGRINQLEVFNESLTERNDKQSQEIGRLKGIIEEMQQGNNNYGKNTG